MSDKAVKKKQYILETARGVFAKKGFKNVTMKDIVEACDISRGGLYIYFDSTESILLACLDLEAKKDFDFSEYSASDALALFLNEQKKAILNYEDDLSVAIYEYLFLKKAEGNTETSLKTEFEKNVDIVTHLLQEGVDDDEFYCEDCSLAAKNIMYTIEGLKLTSRTFGIAEKEIDMELLYILSGLIVEEE